ncbi:pyrophosphate-energized vacuolar membrane proton pump-like [Triticum urartu]|uniref:H(+)-exporting diphosphatase n=1 Tax=Triticum urartu TaxID=4572 RepID=A0A8R7NZ85_TRIUA|nr:pyrophosphate-energized vacuolar membrane proton pump-like [Triticum urartu]
MAVIGTAGAEVLIPLAAVIGIAFAVFQWYVVAKVPVPSHDGEDGGGAAAQKGRSGHDESAEDGVDYRQVEARCAEIQHAISIGATSFLFTEYRYLGVFMAGFAVVIFMFLGSAQRFSTRPEPCTYDPARLCRPALANAAFSMIAFLLGALTSVMSGYLGMRVATFANARTALEARRGVGRAFVVAFRSGAAMGFLLASSALFVLYVAINLFGVYYGDDWGGLYESITGYGLGGSSMALFGRVGGGIYTKAADVGADLVGKVERNIPEDDPRNPAVIADNVGDNVGDIAGMGSDLFGSYAESSCAALFVASISSFGTEHNFAAMMYPLLISAMGIVVCLATTVVATDLAEVKTVEEIGPALKRQILISTVLMTVGIAIVSFLVLPHSFTLFDFGRRKLVKNWYLFICVSAGLWAGLVIGYVTEYFTSNAYRPVQAVANSCRTGAATNVIFGLAVGYKSVIVPIFAIATAIYASFRLAAMYGIALAALGMLSTIATGLSIDAYGPISDNAGGIAEMSGMPHVVRERTDALDAAGNTTAAIGKGFAIGSAALVSLALFGAYVSRAGVAAVDVLSPRVFAGLLVGAMLPYWFSAMTMRSVGSAALAMVEEVRRQFDSIPGLMEGTAKPDYATCVKISTDASLKKMLAPGALVMLSPLVAGTLFGTETLAGLLAGALVSGVQVAISASNSGGAWDNAKKYIEAGASAEARALGPKGSDAHKAAVIGDTIGDPLKDTSGPSLNILIKLMAVEALVFAPFFAAHGGLIFKHL